MSDAKKFDSMNDMLADLVDDTDYRQEVQGEIDRQSLATILFQIRNAHGLTQTELGKKMGRSQSEISKMEHAGDDRISMGDLATFSKALGLNLSIIFQQKGATEAPAVRVVGPSELPDADPSKKKLGVPLSS